MSSLTSPLHDMRVAAPCRASWEKMAGDERVRFCEECALNVYNLSAMTAQEAEMPKIAAEERRHYLRVSRDKTNLAPPGKATWVHLVSAEQRRRPPWG